MTKERIYQERFSVLRKFYENDTPGVNFCNPWSRCREDGKSFPFSVSGSAGLPAAGAMTLRTVFTAESKGVLLLGVGSSRHFKVFCNKVFCFSNEGEGKLYDLPAPENHPFLVPVVKGENILEIELAPGRRSDYFCCRPLEKSALKLPVLLFHPLVTRMGRKGATLVCRTAGAVGCGIQYRKKEESSWQMLWDHRGGLIHRRALHKFFLKNLEEEREYLYRIVMIDPRDPDVKRFSKTFSFKTAPALSRGNYSFFFTADPQFEPAVQRDLLKGVFEAGKAAECDFLVLGGDINSRYSQSRIERDLLHTVEKYGNPAAPLLMLRGNHELRGPEPDNFVDFWGGEDDKTFYMFRYGDTAFLVLDAWENRPSDHPRAKYYSRHNLDEVIKEEEKAFVVQAVNSPLWRTARRRIVFSHGCSFSQRDRAGTMYRFIQELTDEYFEGEKPVSPLHLFLAGHTHIYTRSCPGSDEICAFAMPPFPDKSGKGYLFPAVSCCGPNKKGLPQLSGVRVDAFENGDLKVRSFLPDGSCFEEFIIHEDHAVEEIISLPHFIPVEEE